jgi:hypothetical protein
VYQTNLYTELGVPSCIVVNPSYPASEFIKGNLLVQDKTSLQSSDSWKQQTAWKGGEDNIGLEVFMLVSTHETETGRSCGVRAELYISTDQSV